MKISKKSIGQLSMFDAWTLQPLTKAATSALDHATDEQTVLPIPPETPECYAYQYEPSDAEWQAAKLPDERIPGVCYPGDPFDWTPFFHGTSHLGWPPEPLWITVFDDGRMWEWYLDCGNQPNEYQFPSVEDAKAAGEFLMGRRTAYDITHIIACATKTPMVDRYRRELTQHRRPCAEPTTPPRVKPGHCLSDALANACTQTPENSNPLTFLVNETLRSLGWKQLTPEQQDARRAAAALAMKEAQYGLDDPE